MDYLENADTTAAFLPKAMETESDGTIVNSDKPAGVLPNVMRTEGDGTKATALYHDVCAISPLKDS
jgi:predicted molibdopterin-dependent oxidoreductase YjgC